MTARNMATRIGRMIEPAACNPAIITTTAATVSSILRLEEFGVADFKIESSYQAEGGIMARIPLLIA